MNLVLFTGNDCEPCQEVEEAFKKRFKEELDSGEADIVNLDEEEDAQQFWMENELPLAPTMIVVSDKKKLVTILDPKELLEGVSEEAKK
ncbi:unnamed protein product [marine sediment metagenome]|uniref:Thioredoxin-like fold domain-containing protein n=1 Tax=marine sediment metagenome TaxID=412755 RepID=X1TP77_9ZZZZ